MSDPTSDDTSEPMTEPATDNTIDPKYNAGTVHPIAHMTFAGDAATRKVALVLSDADGAANSYAINPAAVRALLPPLLSLAATWSGDPDLSPEGVAGPQNALAAKYIHFTKGRVDTECAVRVFLGKDIDLSFIIPLESVLASFQNFAKNVQFRPKRPN